MVERLTVVPLHRVSTVEAVANAVRAQVLDGDLTPGTQLREVALAQAYGVARHGVRAALHSLVQEGLLRHLPNRGVFVPRLTTADVTDLHTLRCAVELEAVGRLADGAGSLQGVRKALGALASLPADAPWRDLVMADLAIHRAMVDAVGSHRLSRVHASLIAELRLGLASLSEKGEKRSSMLPEHRDLVAAIAGGSRQRATALMRAHLDQAATDLAAVVVPAERLDTYWTAES